MEEEDIRGTKRGHDPHQPAHVARPGTQLPQVQPGKALTDITTSRYTLLHTHTHTHIFSRIGCLPWGVGGSDEEVDHHPITHVETVLDRPEERDQTVLRQLSDNVYTASVCLTSQKQI